jgi:O-antigen/teichoic acid export membrane protein
MIAYILLVPGKAFSLPDNVSAAIIGLFFGLVCGLFYYQHYYKPYFWVISLAGGVFLTVLSHSFFLKKSTSDDLGAILLTIASFGIPFILTMLLNQGLYYIKKSKRKKRSKQRRPARFFDTTIHPEDTGHSSNTREDLAG